MKKQRIIKNNNAQIYNNFVKDFIPKQWSELIGNEALKKIMTGWIINNTIPKQGILISGNIGVGKTVWAQMLVKAAACKDRKSGVAEPCSKCHVCLSASGFFVTDDIGSNIHADSFLVRLRQIKMSGTKVAWIDGDDEVGEWHPLLIDELHEVPKQVEKYLRKELEGEWSNSFLVATSAEPDKIDPALRNRLYKIHLNPPTMTELVEWMGSVCSKAGIQVDDVAALELIAGRSEECFRSILHTLQKIRDMGENVNIKAAEQALLVGGC